MAMSVRRSSPRHSRAVSKALLHAWWLETNTLVRTHVSVAVTVTLFAASALLIGTAAFGEILLAIVASNAVAADTLFATLMAVMVFTAKGYYSELYRGGWLSTLPTSRRTVAGMMLIRTLFWPVSLMLLLGVVALIIRVHAAESVDALRTATPGLAAAAWIGVLIGWLTPRRIARKPAASGSRASEIIAPGHPNLAALSQWATTQTRQSLQPRALSRVLVPALLALPLGISANQAVALLAVFVLLVYLGVLLWAVRRALRAGAAWLRPTPLAFSRVALALVRRPLVLQLQWTLISAVLLMALGCTPRVAARLAQLWLAFVAVLSGFGLTDARQPGPTMIRVLVSVSAVALVERLRAFLALPLALLISAWHVGRAART